MNRHSRQASQRKSDDRDVPVGRRIEGARVVVFDTEATLVDLGLDRPGVIAKTPAISGKQYAELEDAFQSVGEDPAELEVDVTIVGAEEERGLLTVWPSEDPTLVDEDFSELEKLVQRSIKSLDLEHLLARMTKLESEHRELRMQEDQPESENLRKMTWVRKTSDAPGSRRSDEDSDSAKAARRQLRRKRLNELKAENDRLLEHAERVLQELPSP